MSSLRTQTSRRAEGAYADKGLAALETARACVELGACKRTIELMTGLPATFILRFVFDKHTSARRGRPPYSDEFLGRASLRLQAAASAFAARYCRLRESGFTAAESLITAYRHYMAFPGAPELLFDEAFYLCCNLDGIWACQSRTLQLVDCLRCGSRHLQALGAVPTRSCAFCKERRSADRSDGDQHQPPAGQIRTSQTLQERLGALKVRRGLKSLGASERSIDALMSTMPQLPEHLRPAPPSSLVFSGLPLPLERWGINLNTVRRVQYSLLVSVYRRLMDAGFGVEESLIAAYQRLEPLFRKDCPLTLDRCLEVVSLLEARWGAQRPELGTRLCEACSTTYVVSFRDSSAQPCPFCLLKRYPTQYKGPGAPGAADAQSLSKAAFPLEVDA